MRRIQFQSNTMFQYVYEQTLLVYPAHSVVYNELGVLFFFFVG